LSLLSILPLWWNIILVKRETKSFRRAAWTHWAGMISVSFAIPAYTSDAPVYFPAFASFRIVSAHQKNCRWCWTGGVRLRTAQCRVDWSSGVRRLDDPAPSGDAWYRRGLLLRRLLLRRLLPTSYNDVFSRRPALLSDAELKLHRAR